MMLSPATPRISRLIKVGSNDVSIQILNAQLSRFLASKEPEVLCIRGRWGVGKTFGWNHALDAAVLNQNMALQRYAYVSLFGLNSITELRNSIVQETRVIVKPPAGWKNALTRSTQGGEHLIRQHARPLLNAGGGLAKIASGGDALYSLGFLSAEHQLICLDDLERAGEKLPIRDTLGLVSLLREQRACKVVLLFNDDAMGKSDKEELALQMEKVVDITLTFDPTSKEASEIILAGSDPVDSVLKDRVARLGLVNLRVIKKIQRAGHEIASILAGYRNEIRDAALATVVLAGWSIWQPAEAPSPEFLLTFNGFTLKKDEDQTDVWTRKIREYGYSHSDEMDTEIIRGLVRGYFNSAALKAQADAQQDQLTHQEAPNEFSEAWELYHQTLAVDDEVILDMMFRGARDGIQTITPGNMNSAIVFLRRYGRSQQASELVRQYVSARAPASGFFGDSLLFFDGERDQELVAAYEKFRTSQVDLRDPVQVLSKIVEHQGYNPEDVALVAKLDADNLEKMFLNYRGPRLKNIVEWVARFSREDSAQGRVLQHNLRSACERIAELSPMRATRLRLWTENDQAAGSVAAGEKEKHRPAGRREQIRRRRIHRNAPQLGFLRRQLRRGGRPKR